MQQSNLKINGNANKCRYFNLFYIQYISRGTMKRYKDLGHVDRLHRCIVTRGVIWCASATACKDDKAPLVAGAIKR
jgi:hypothetical protein